MKVNEIQISGVKIITQNCYHDYRGYFVESYNQAQFDEYSNLKSSWLQDNLSYSKQGTLRGLHYQFPHAQAKLNTSSQRLYLGCCARFTARLPNI
nr:dTDP-4-dehydrorhamnose 3,5-epimerase family protein [Pelistega indica]